MIDPADLLRSAAVQRLATRTTCIAAFFFALAFVVQWNRLTAANMASRILGDRLVQQDRENASIDRQCEAVLRQVGAVVDEINAERVRLKEAEVTMAQLLAEVRVLTELERNVAAKKEEIDLKLQAMSQAYDRARSQVPTVRPQ